MGGLLAEATIISSARRVHGGKLAVAAADRNRHDCLARYGSHGLGDKPFWLDEVASLNRATSTLPDLVAGSLHSKHYPTYFLFLAGREARRIGDIDQSYPAECAMIAAWRGEKPYWIMLGVLARQSIARAQIPECSSTKPWERLFAVFQAYMDESYNKGRKLCFMGISPAPNRGRNSQRNGRTFAGNGSQRRWSFLLQNERDGAILRSRSCVLPHNCDMRYSHCRVRSI